MVTALAGCAHPAAAAVWSDGHARSPGVGGPSPSLSTDPSATASASAVPSPSTTPAPQRTSAKPAPKPTTGSAAAQAILAQVNKWRAAAGRRPYTMPSGLVTSAHKHNALMVAGCGMSHRCDGEPDLRPRIIAAGIHCNAVGENIGLRGYFGADTASITKAAVMVAQDWFNEGPGGGHHDALVSSTFTRIGIDVIRDSKGVVWVTADFAD